jgi:hypothetical protein
MSEFDVFSNLKKGSAKEEIKKEDDKLIKELIKKEEKPEKQLDDPKEKIKLIYSIQHFGKNKRFGDYLKHECNHDFSESYLRKLFINENNNFKYINNDDIKNKIINDKLINKHNKEINYIIDDNTNTTLKSRNDISKIYKDHFKIGIYFNYDIDTSMHLNYMRMFWYGYSLIKKVAYNTLNKKFNIPTEKEFDLLIELNKIIPEFDLETSVKYYF